MLMMEGGLSVFIVSLEMTTLYIIKYTQNYVNVKIPFLVSTTSRECVHITEMRVALKIKHYGVFVAPRDSFKQAVHHTDETPSRITNFLFKLAGGRIM